MVSSDRSEARIGGRSISVGVPGTRGSSCGEIAAGHLGKAYLCGAPVRRQWYRITSACSERALWIKLFYV